MGNWFTNFWDRLKAPWDDGYNFGDITSGVVSALFGGAGDAVSTAVGAATSQPGSNSGSGNIWDDLTGKSNTTAQNDTAAALQEDAQAFNELEARKQRDFEAEQALLNRQWQEMMSNTAYQRSVADLKKAGLNPWLAVGNGASTGQVTSVGGSSASSAVGSAQASNVNMLASLGSAAAGIGILIKAIKAATKA